MCKFKIETEVNNFSVFVNLMFVDTNYIKKWFNKASKLSTSLKFFGSKALLR